MSRHGSEPSRSQPKKVGTALSANGEIAEPSARASQQTAQDPRVSDPDYNKTAFTHLLRTAPPVPPSPGFWRTGRPYLFGGKYDAITFATWLA